MAIEKRLTFGTEADNESPRIIETFPDNSANEIPTYALIQAKFSEVMQSSTITTTTFKVHNGINYIPGTVSFDKIEGHPYYRGATVASFKPSSPLDPSSVYTVTISAIVKDSTGKSLAQDIVWSFRTTATRG
jgi:hypothetical protein